jgi:sugar phosphate isomerase/epimerase
MSYMSSQQKAAPRVSVSTWSLHRTLGDPVKYGAEQGTNIPVETHGRGSLSLLELPAHLAEFGIHTLEICHFHLPSLDKGYLAELRAALEAAHVELFSLLVDEGDMTHPQLAEQNWQWIASWVDVAAQLGAKRMRAVAGRSQPSAETVDMSVRGLQRLVERTQAQGLRLMTENWLELLSSPDVVRQVFERLEGNVGLCFDFGNWGGPTKYEALQQIVQWAESCHAKAHFEPAGEMDRVDYERCFEITRMAGFSGPYTLIYDGPDADEWRGLQREKEVVAPYLH